MSASPRDSYALTPPGVSFPRSFVPRSFVPSFLRSFVPSFLRSSLLAPSLLRSFAPSLPRSRAPSFPRSLARPVPAGLRASARGTWSALSRLTRPGPWARSARRCRIRRRSMSCARGSRPTRPRLAGRWGHCEGARPSRSIVHRRVLRNPGGWATIQHSPLGRGLAPTTANAPGAHPCWVSVGGVSSAVRVGECWGRLLSGARG
jgi:hypothetical protein